MNDPIIIADVTARELIFNSALCSKRDGGQDAIDFCICQALVPEDKSVFCVLGHWRRRAVALFGTRR